MRGFKLEYFNGCFGWSCFYLGNHYISDPFLEENFMSKRNFIKLVKELSLNK